MRPIRDWHRQQAEMLAKQLPRDWDDAITVVDCLAELLLALDHSSDELPELRAN